MEENNVEITEKKSIKDKAKDFFKTNKQKIVKGAAIAGGTLAGVGLLGFLASKLGNSDDIDEFEFEEYDEYLSGGDTDGDDEESDKDSEEN